MAFVLMVSGWKRSGKDTIADHLVKNHGFIKIPFAKGLKDMTSQTYKVERSWFDDDDKKDLPLLDYPANASDDSSAHMLKCCLEHLRTTEGDSAKELLYWRDGNRLYVMNKNGERRMLYHSPRSLLVMEGTCKRSVLSEFWVRDVASQIKDGGSYVISDFRYRSEFADLTSLLSNATIDTMRVNRFDHPPANEASERDLDHFEFGHVIDNRISSGVTKEQLLQQVDAILEKKM